MKSSECALRASHSLCLLCYCVQMASRSLRQQLVPVLTVRLCLSRGEGTGAEQRKLFQTQPGTLLHLISSLEDALAAMKSSHTRRILRNIK